MTLAYDLAHVRAGRGLVGAPGTDVGERGLRMLAVFSLPTATSVLALRRERFELARLVRQIAARQRRRVELTVVQYGATRERLVAVAEAGDGWDVLHLSGHGGRASSCWKGRRVPGSGGYRRAGGAAGAAARAGAAGGGVGV